MKIIYCESCGTKLQGFPTGKEYFDQETGELMEIVEVTCPVAYKMSLIQRIWTQHRKNQDYYVGYYPLLVHRSKRKNEKRKESTKP